MVTDKEKKLYDFLDELGIAYTRHEHPPVYTVDEAAKHWQNIDGTQCKNLFLRNSKGNQHYLVVLEQSQKVDLGSLAEKTGAGKLSFASGNRLSKYLDLETGAVSPFGLINDTNREVRVVLDKNLKRGDLINFHPNVNTATITLSYKDFERYLARCGNEVTYL